MISFLSQEEIYMHRKRWKKEHLPKCQQEIALSIGITGILISSLFSITNISFLIKYYRFWVMFTKAMQSHSNVIIVTNSGKSHKQLTGSYPNSTNLLFSLELVLLPVWASGSTSLKWVYTNSIYLVGLLGRLKIKCSGQYPARDKQARGCCRCGASGECAQLSGAASSPDRLPGAASWLWHLAAVGPWACNLTSLGFVRRLNQKRLAHNTYSMG